MNFEGEETIKGTIMLRTGGFVFVDVFFRESQPEIHFLFFSRCEAVLQVDRLVKAVNVIGYPGEFNSWKKTDTYREMLAQLNGSIPLK